MNRVALLLAVAMIVPAAMTLAQQPPIIDRELFFGDPEISGAQISPDGNYISFIKPFKNVRNIWVKGRAEAFEKARPLTADTTRPVRSYFWARDGKSILYVQDKGGDENYRIYAVDPSAVGDPVPAARDLTPLKNVRAMIYDVPKKTPNEIIIGLNDRKAELHDVYRLNILTGERKLIRENNENVAGWSTDLDGAIRLGTRITNDGGSEILRVENDKLIPIYTVNAEESCGPVRFTPDGKKFFLETNKGTKTDKAELQLFDLATGKTTLVEKDPKNEVDFGSALFSDLTNEILATFYEGDKVRIYPKQKKFGDDYAKMKKLLPDGEVSITGMTEDETVWMVVVSSDVDPGSRYLYDRKTAKVEMLYRSRPNLPSEHLATVKPVRYKSRDGKTIPGYLALPKGISAKSLPTVMVIHGGPWGRVAWGYDPELQYLANRGYAAFTMNFRGSTGYGKKFLNAGNKQWGTGFMQHDISDAVKYLVKEGIADPKRVAIYGGSYGGYATLAGVAFTPDLYAAGISYVGPSNIITLLNSIPPYWAPVKKIFAVRVGDMEKPADLKMLAAQSPLNSATQIKAPLLVIQGANDPRVKKRESDQIVVALRDLGRQVEYMVAPDEGHGFAGKENRLAVYAAMERFFAKHLGGRYQESLPDYLKKKLEALTVDIKSVKVTAPAVEGAAEGMPKFDGSLLKEDTLKYNVAFDMRGQKMSMSVKRTLQKATYAGKPVWRIVEETSGLMGAAADTLDVDASTLLPIRRQAQQGPAVVKIEFTPTAVTGAIAAQGQNMPINVKLTSPALCDGAGVDIPVCTLPLADGYKTTISQFDLMGAKVKTMSLKTTGSEKVTVGGKSFDTFKVEIKPQEGEEGSSTLWIAKDVRRIVKMENKLPAQMGGGIVTSELVQ
jgi:dipeptidyl aminopeptidase/acylaminoacyl peptidase